MEGVDTHPLISQLRPIFADLRNCTQVALPSTLLKLDYVIEDERDALFHRDSMSSSSSSSNASLLLPNWINKQLRDLFANADTQLAGIRVVRALLRVEYMGRDEMTRLFSELLEHCIIYTKDFTIGMEAAQVWGQLLNNGSSVVDSIVSTCLSYSIPLLKSNDSSAIQESPLGDAGSVTRLSACVFVLQIAMQVPSAIVQHLASVLEGFQAAAWDKNQRVRDAASDALFYTLRIAYRTCEESFCHHWQEAFLTQICSSLESNLAHIVHGDLRCFNAIVSSVSEPADFRLVPFSSAGRQSVHAVWSFVTRDLGRVNVWPDHEVREQISTVFPVLAKYDPTTYGQPSFTKIRQICRATFDSDDGPDDRNMVFAMLSKMLSALPDMMDLLLDDLMAYIEHSLTDRPKRRRCLAAVSCFATCAEEKPNAVRPFLRHLLGPIFAGSITEGFAVDIGRVCAAFPELRSTCLFKMLDSIKQQLSKIRRLNVSEDESAPLIIGNLNSLSTLDFTGYSTLYFLCDAVLRFVCDPNEEVRRRAVDLCFKLVHSGCVDSPCETTKEGIIIHHGREHMRLVLTVVRKMVSVAVTDTESDIRLHTLEQFTPAFDYILAQEDVVKSLSPALYDKHQNRLAAVRLLARVSRRNPAYIYPMLRHVVLQGVVDTQLISVSKKQEQSTVVLSAIMEIAPDVMKPYVSSLLADCVRRLQHPSAPVTIQTALLSFVGKLARYAEGADVAVVATAQPIVVEHILDSSNIYKKHEAIRALGDIIRATKNADVYETYPELLRVLLSALHGGFKESWPVRQDVLKLMGIIGAVDPLKVKQIARLHNTSSNGGGGGGGGTSGGSSSSKANTAFVPSAALVRSEQGISQSVVTKVLEVLQLPSLSEDQYVCAVRVITNILAIEEVKYGCLVSYYGEIVSTVLRHIAIQTKSQDKMLSLLTRIAYLLGPHIRPHIGEILAVLTGTVLLNADRGVLVEALCLLGELRRSLREEFAPYLATVLSPIITLLLKDPGRCGEPIFAFFIEMGSLLDDFLPNLLPYVCDIISSVSSPPQCRMGAVDSIRHFARRLPRLSLHASRALHSICGLLKGYEHVGGGGGVVGGTAEDALIAVSLDALRDIARNLGREFEKYTPMVFPVLNAYGSDGQEVKNYILAATRSCGHVVASAVSWEQADKAAASRFGGTDELPNHRKSGEDTFANFLNMMRASESETEDYWNVWVKQLAVELLRLSPSRSHQYGYPLAVAYEPFARQMLHSAFAVYYGEMNDSTKALTVQLLGNVLRDEKVPSEVLQELLNLAEFMERLEMRFDPKKQQQTKHSASLLFSLTTLMESSERCNLYSKALHYVEIQFHEITYAFEKALQMGQARPLPHEEWENLLHLCEKSIYLCNVLGQRESAEGMLKYLQLNFTFLTGRSPSELPRMMDAQLFEKLQWWSQSLVAYEQRISADPNNFSNIMGLVRSFDNLGDYWNLLQVWKILSPKVSRKELVELSPYGAHAAWLLRKWDDMEEIASLMPDEGYDGTTAVFYRAVLAVHRGTFHEAERHINLLRKRLDSTLSALVAESYDRAYKLFVGIQQTSELEEFMFVLRNHQNLKPWQELWEKRLGAMAYEGWPGTLANHTLVIPPDKEIDMWLRFVTLSHRSGRESTSTGILHELLGSQDIVSALQQPTLPSPAITLSSFQHLYDTHQKDQAILLLKEYTEKMDLTDLAKLSESDRQKLAQCHSKLASWLLAERKLINSGTAQGVAAQKALSQRLRRGGADTSADEPQQVQYHRFRGRLNESVFHHLERATSLDSNNGFIWHTWARFNHDLVNEESAHGTLPTAATSTAPAGGSSSSPHAAAMATRTTETPFFDYVTHALSGYLKSVCLSEELEDLLGFLSLWFSYGPQVQVHSNASIQADLTQVNPSAWLKVIPQVMARLHSKDSTVSELVHNLLVTIARAHPQALLYSLNVVNAGSSSADQSDRQLAAQRILVRITELHPHGRELVNDAALVCKELVRCAVLWTELWFDELERVWHQWGRDENPHNVLASLRPLLERMRSPETMAESHFVAEFGELLNSACDSVLKACNTGNPVYMEEAWNGFRTAIQGMNAQIGNMSSLALQLVSPQLVKYGKNLSLVVPGQYSEGPNYPRIASFQSTLKVMTSKQHPRRLYMTGTDGQLYKFLLKGHEDLRLDERVMQLLAFVNTLLEKHSQTQKRDSMIQVFSVTPLSDNAGLVGWVDHCDTLHQLIKEYRGNSRNLSLELKHMESFVVPLDTLTCIQHIEPFEYALEKTEGTDLADSMWIRAPSAESWLDRRSTYVSSLATMSMVGHVLGLGDRHPSNLMIHAFSGRVVHIDFGDCFEVAQTRSSFPEKVPFRLTRMLVKAMEIGGIEGIFRHDCATVMEVLREEGSSILALLEAFVHDPLVSWWRTDTEEGAAATGRSGRGPDDAQRGDRPRRRTGTSAASYLSVADSFKRPHSSMVGSVKRTCSVSPAAAVSAASTVDKHHAGAAAATDANAAEASSPQVSKAQQVVNRVQEKLEGREFNRNALPAQRTTEGMNVDDQVARLILEATANENLCVHYEGWCAFW